MSPHRALSSRFVMSHQMPSTHPAATIVAPGLIMNIMPLQPAKPRNDSPACTRNAGRHAGLPSISSRPDDRFSSAYAVRLKMVRTGASALMSPSHTPAAAIRNVSADARRGSFDSPYPLPRKRGTTLSRASDCSVRGAASSPPSALDSDAAHTPATMSHGILAHFCITSGSPSSVARSATKRWSTTGTAM